MSLENNKAKSKVPYGTLLLKLKNLVISKDFVRMLVVSALVTLVTFAYIFLIGIPKTANSV